MNMMKRVLRSKHSPTSLQLRSRTVSETLVVLLIIGVSIFAFISVTLFTTGFLEKFSGRNIDLVSYGGVARVAGLTTIELKLYLSAKGSAISILQTNSSVVAYTSTSQMNCVITSIRPTLLDVDEVYEVTLEVRCGSIPYNARLHIKLAWVEVGSNIIRYHNIALPLTS